MVFGDGAFGRWLGLDEVIRVVSSRWDQRLYKQRSSVHWGKARWKYSEEVANPVQARKRAPPGVKSAPLILDFLVSGTMEKKKTDCLSHSVYDILL